MRISHERLLELINYDPETGLVISKYTNFNKTRVKGEVLGCLQKTTGYLIFNLERKLYTAHTIAWFYMTKEWPDRNVDHKDRVKTNNRWDNLRLATPGQNQGNGKWPVGITGYTGAHPYKSQFRAVIKFKGIAYTLGKYDTPQEAHEVYKKKHIELHGKFSIYYGKENE